MSIQGLIRYQTFIRSELVERIEELEAERDKWKTDHELLVTDYKQLLIDLNKKDAEIKILEAEKEALQSTVNWYMENE